MVTRLRHDRIDVVDIRFFFSLLFPWDSFLSSPLLVQPFFLPVLLLLLRFFTSVMFRPVRRDYVVKTLMLLSRSLVLCLFDLGLLFPLYLSIALPFPWLFLSFFSLSPTGIVSTSP